MPRFSISRLLASTITAVLLTSVLASAAAAWDTSCGSGKVCNYRDRDFGLPLAAMAGSDTSYVGDVYPNTTESLNDSVSSVINMYSSQDVTWFHDTGGGGSSFCLNPGVGALWVGLLDNDKFSRHAVAADNNACP